MSSDNFVHRVCHCIMLLFIVVYSFVCDIESVGFNSKCDSDPGFTVNGSVSQGTKKPHLITRNIALRHCIMLLFIVVYSFVCDCGICGFQFSRLKLDCVASVYCDWVR